MAYIDEKDTLTGIERYHRSEAYGELVVPVITLWKEPGLPPKADNVAGVLDHGAEVQVTQKKRRQGRDWYFVRNEEQDQEGWIVAAFLDRLGETDARRVS